MKNICCQVRTTIFSSDRFFSLKMSPKSSKNSPSLCSLQVASKTRDLLKIFIRKSTIDEKQSVHSTQAIM